MPDGPWNGKRVVVTGGGGFLGSFVVRRLAEAGADQIVIPRSKECDLREREDVVRLLAAARPHMVIHLAATVGGIGANRQNPGRFFYDNASSSSKRAVTASRSSSVSARCARIRS